MLSEEGIQQSDGNSKYLKKAPSEKRYKNTYGNNDTHINNGNYSPDLDHLDNEGGSIISATERRNSPMLLKSQASKKLKP